MPRLSTVDAATRAARDLIHALQHPAPAGPFHVAEPIMDALTKLSNIF